VGVGRYRETGQKPRDDVGGAVGRLAGPEEPRHVGHVVVGGPHRVTLYHNNRDGTFTDVTVQAGLGGLPRAYQGTGVVVGVLDSGIDFTHPDFKTSAGKTRLKGLLDFTLFSTFFASYSRNFMIASPAAGRAAWLSG